MQMSANWSKFFESTNFRTKMIGLIISVIFGGMVVGSVNGVDLEMSQDALLDAWNTHNWVFVLITLFSLGNAAIHMWKNKENGETWRDSFTSKNFYVDLIGAALSFSLAFDIEIDPTAAALLVEQITDKDWGKLIGTIINYIVLPIFYAFKTAGKSPS